MTKALQANQMRAVVKAIRANRRFLISSHVNPEGDALGSALALASLLKRLGKEARLAQEGGIPEAFSFFPRLAQVIDRPPRRNRVDCAMTVDVPVLGRLGSMEPVVCRAPLLICIDHHVSNQRFGHINWVDPKAAATGEMIYRLYEAFHLKPTKEEAECMYVSIVTDTGSFRYINTTHGVLGIAASLVARGVSPLKVSQALYEAHSLADIRFLGRVLSEVQHTPDNRIVWLELSRPVLLALKPSEEVLDELVNFPRSVRTAEVAMVLRDAFGNGTIRVNLRSKGRINVDLIARHFGGGGHPLASGCTIPGTLAQVRAGLLARIRQALKRL
ncbi:MAG: bifunctional oligoribonuclease/PAP phosphatase NrnA [Candidatus Omnitrophica bacterium]|nr:bifunctional oligoribonuclease/PAP phosphatase NrnA [Candidatus Omnitrophota bacterium]